jgi:steroid 5-alpha reductase family enzyme
MFPLLEASACVVVSWLLVGYIVSLVIKRGDIADTFWGLGFASIGLVTYWRIHSFALSWAIFGMLMPLVWGLRLSHYIFWRNHGKPEDFRYATWRREWGSQYLLRSFLQIWCLQGVLLWLVSMPVAFSAAQSETDCPMLAVAGIVVWAIGLGFEAVGDAQLARWRIHPSNRGKIIDVGLWHYTRHPNYFGEVLLWWGVYLFAASFTGGWKTLVGPLTITVLILKVSGIPMLEKKYEGRPDFEAYKKRTSAFFPWFPKRGTLKMEP